MTEKLHLAGSQPNQRTRISQAIYVAWFQKRSRSMLVQITVYANEQGQKVFRITEVEPIVLVRGYAIPVLLLGLSLFLLRRSKPSAAMKPYSRFKNAFASVTRGNSFSSA